MYDINSIFVGESSVKCKLEVYTQVILLQKKKSKIFIQVKSANIEGAFEWVLVYP